MNYKLIMVLFLAVAILIGAPMVSAKSNYLSSFNNYYDTSSTKLDTCNTCHGSSSGGSFNAYGVAYSKNGRNLASIEGLDSDQDGFTNIEEIKALTFPGDVNDHPQTTSTTTTNVTQQQQTTAISDDDDDIEEELEDEKESDDDIKEQLNTSVPASNVTEEKPTTEEPVNNTDETPKSPGFETIFAVIGLITIAGLRRK